MTDPNDDMLDDVFAQARNVAPRPSEALMARVLADADMVRQAGPAPASAQAGLCTRLLSLIGGWPAVGGLAVATFAGIWVGVSPPAMVEDFTASNFGDAVTIGFFAEDLVFDMGTLTDG